MFQKIRTSVLAALLIALLSFAPPFNKVILHGVQDARDFFDDRPERSVLFVGNSRTFVNDMPDMVRRIADSAGSPDKYRIWMHAPANATLADHWKNQQLQAMLTRGWQYVIFQAQSGEQYDKSLSVQMVSTAKKLIDQARSHGSTPAMFVTWRYITDCPEFADHDPVPYRAMHDNIQQKHNQLNRETGVDLVNVGLVWEAVQSREPGFSLYDDCNHPSIYGSYLSALMFYAYFSAGNVDAVTYVPDGIEQSEAAFLRSVVSIYSRTTH